jgi:diguanylate cyclase (GGDEF)-like protein
MASASPGPRRRKPSLPSVVGPVLDALVAPATATGAGIVAPDSRSGRPVTLYQTGNGPTLLRATDLLSSGAHAPVHGLCPDRRPILAGPWQTPFGQPGVLAFWREVGAKPWRQQDHALVLMTAAMLTAAIGHIAPPRRTTWRNATDGLTGLPRARKFAADLPRHFARLDKDRLPGTLIVASIDGFSQLNARFGRKATEEMLREVARLLNRITRPTDVVARIGPDEFALWLNGADHLTAAERAEQLRVAAPHVLAVVLQEPNVSASLSIGIAARQPGSTETVAGLLCRADYALHEAKSAGPGLWRVSREKVG